MNAISNIKATSSEDGRVEGIEFGLGLEDESHWALQEALDFLQELRGSYPIEDPMVDGERDAHPLAGDDLAVLHHRLVLDRADRQDAGIGRVDDGRELIDVVHAQVRDAERVAEVVLR